MRAALPGAFLFVTLIAASAGAQTYDHVHLAAPEPAKAVEWYRAHLGAQAGDLPDRVQFGRTIFAFTQSANAQPSEGSVIDHLGLSFTNLEAKVKELEAAGAKVITPLREAPGLFKLAFVQDPSVSSWNSSKMPSCSASTISTCACRIPKRRSRGTCRCSAASGRS